MRLNTLKPAVGAKQVARRVGRGLLSLARREARAGIDDAIEPRNRS